MQNASVTNVFYMIHSSEMQNASVKNVEYINDIQQSEKQKNPSSFSASFSARQFLCQRVR